MEQMYEIAGLLVQMDTFGKTLEQAKPYQTTKSASPDIVLEQRWMKTKQTYPYWSDERCEYLVTGYDFYKQLLNFDGMMLHSSAVVVDGKAYLFTANSGTGKSTHTKLWLELLGEKAYILNDDKPALRREKDGWYAYGTPWSGKHNLSRNEKVSLGGIAVIDRAAENSISRLEGIEGVVQVLRQVNRPKAVEFRQKLMILLDLLLREIPVWSLKCNMNLEAAKIAYEAMSGKEQRL